MRLKTSLVVQEGIMIPQMESPVLRLPQANDNNGLYLLPATVRFLRCGCPNVQWLAISNSEENFANEMLDVIQNALVALQRAGENFKIESPSEHNWKEGAVFTITRIVAPKTEEMIFGNLKAGDYFLDSLGRHMMKIDEGQIQAVLVVDFKIDGSVFPRGMVLNYLLSDPVKKIVE